MARSSAGIVLWRRAGPAGPSIGPDGFEVLVVHPGGPYWVRRDDGWWSIPKGEPGPGEDLLEAAEREFREELGVVLAPGPRLALGEIVQKGGKRVIAWAVEGDLDPTLLAGDTFEIEWPPRSGTLRSFPEVDRAAWCSPAEARRKLLAAQTPFVDRLSELLSPSGPPSPPAPAV